MTRNPLQMWSPVAGEQLCQLCAILDCARTVCWAVASFSTEIVQLSTEITTWESLKNTTPPDGISRASSYFAASCTAHISPYLHKEELKGIRNDPLQISPP
ncbi:hypothetical protein CEXT_461601 [Caerostris extrusa]|uniref:Uncharacterized protein n=1 Tax=Caerostris extrusa TaxID=172846 RepID=A0AAV4X4P2_CAEEX|nr:hypothetical protein CEXT_461601 [Caerostris extrusa]